MLAPRTLQTKPGQVTFTQAPGLAVTAAADGDFQEFHLTASGTPGVPLLSMLERVGRFLVENGAVIVRQQVFGPLAWEPEAMRLMRQTFGEISWPVTWVEGSAGDNEGAAGMHFLAVAGTEVRTVLHEGNVIGASFEDGFARHLFVGNLVPSDCFGSPARQTRQVYDLLQSTMKDAGMSLPDVVRTWLFLDGICSWYGDFNKVRNIVYAGQNLQKLPASTGVGVSNAQGAKLVAEAWAMQPLGAGVAVQEISSPLQCSAPQYGSGFSRATEVSTPAWRRLTISGTASIAPEGDSVHEGDIDAQIHLTMEVIEAILKSRGLTFRHTSRMTAYFKDVKQSPRFERWLCANRMDSLPLIMAQADICRPELLFEVEMDAMAPAN